MRTPIPTEMAFGVRLSAFGWFPRANPHATRHTPHPPRQTPHAERRTPTTGADDVAMTWGIVAITFCLCCGLLVGALALQQQPRTRQIAGHQEGYHAEHDGHDDGLGEGRRQPAVAEQAPLVGRQRNQEQSKRSQHS